VWQVRGRLLEPSLVIGIVNVTPDSFSDGGRFFDTAGAVAHGRRLLDEGAALLDVGGESTRPGADPVDAEDEMKRVLPVIEAFANDGAIVSVDTSKPSVAMAAIEAGAAIINDVTALADPEMAHVAVSTGAGVILMHMQGTPRTMQRNPSYGDVVREVREYLVARSDFAQSVGIEREAIAIDPGMGFGKTVDQNLALLGNVQTLVATGYPVVVGTSRKAFLGTVSGRAVTERDVATAATVALSVAAGVFAVRVHNVAAAQDARRIAEAIVNA